MSETIWYEIFRRYIENYNSIKGLLRAGILDDEQYQELMMKLLEDIIEAFREEVED